MPARDRLRLWILCSGGLIALLLVVQLFIVDGYVEAKYLHQSFGPFDFSDKEGTPKKSLAVKQQWESWKIAGWIFNLLLSWGLLTAALRPQPTLEWSLAFSSRRSAIGLVIGVTAAGLSFANFTLDNATGATWMLVALGGLLLAGASTGWVRTAKQIGRLCGGAAILTLLGITLPALLQDPEPLDMIYKEDALFEVLQAQLYGTTALLLYLSRKNAALKARIVLLLGAVGFAFIAAEEVSWGQRFIDFDTPDFWVNEQGETTLHNMSGIKAFFNYRLVLQAWAFLSIAAAFLPWIRNKAEYYGLPIVPFVGWVALAGALAVHTPTYHDWYRNTDEIQETLGALAALCAGFLTRYRTAGLLQPS